MNGSKIHGPYKVCKGTTGTRIDARGAVKPYMYSLSPHATASMGNLSHRGHQFSVFQRQGNDFKNRRRGPRSSFQVGHEIVLTQPILNPRQSSDVFRLGSRRDHPPGDIGQLDHATKYRRHIPCYLVYSPQHTGRGRRCARSWGDLQLYSPIQGV